MADSFEKTLRMLTASMMSLLTTGLIGATMLGFGLPVPAWFVAGLIVSGTGCMTAVIVMLIRLHDAANH